MNILTLVIVLVKTKIILTLVIVLVKTKRLQMSTGLILDT